jgi:hypothetical protein
MLVSNFLDNKKLFWDVNTKNLNIDKHQTWIISRVLESGTFDDLGVLFQIYSPEKIQETVKKSRQISLRTGIFWANYFNINEKIQCMMNQLPKGQKKLWIN